MNEPKITVTTEKACGIGALTGFGFGIIPALIGLIFGCGFKVLITFIACGTIFMGVKQWFINTKIEEQIEALNKEKAEREFRLKEEKEKRQRLKNISEIGNVVKEKLKKRDYENINEFINSLEADFKPNAIKAKHEVENETLKYMEDVINERYPNRWSICLEKSNYLNIISATNNMNRVIDELKKINNKYLERKKIYIMNSSVYGELNKELYEEIKESNGYNVNSYIDTLYTKITRGDRIDRTLNKCFIGNDVINSSILNIDLDKVLSCLWFYAMAMPHDAERYKKVAEIYNFYCTNSNINTENNSDKEEDININLIASELLISKNIGEGVLSDKWKAYWKVKREKNKEVYYNLASFLMAIKAYNFEGEILRVMVGTGMILDENLQNRLRFLESGNEVETIIHEVDNKSSALHFDYSSKDWTTDDINGFFKQLAYEGTRLSYSLNMREWSKTISVPLGSNGLNLNEIFEKVNVMKEEEYDNAIDCEMNTAIIMPVELSERMEVISISPKKENFGFDHISLLLSVTKIGKNISIRIYTIFNPKEGIVEKQQQQVISLKKNMNPNVIAFEEGIKESILGILENIINNNDDVDY